MAQIKQYRAFGTGNTSALGNTPRLAAQTFFEAYPSKRQCDIVEGVQDGAFFTVSYGRAAVNEWPKSYNGITKGKIERLPH